MIWQRQDALKYCEQPVRDTGLRSLAFPDSTAAEAAARRLLGARLDTAHSRRRTVTQTGNGVFMQFVDDRPGVVDGSASVYVSIGPCVTWLGW